VRQHTPLLRHRSTTSSSRRNKAQRHGSDALIRVEVQWCAGTDVRAWPWHFGREVVGRRGAHGQTTPCQECTPKHTIATLVAHRAPTRTARARAGCDSRLTTLCWLQMVREITAVARCDLRLGCVVRRERGSSKGGWGVHTHANARTNGITVGNKMVQPAKPVREVRNNTQSAWESNRRKWHAAWWILEAKKR
jgi:hypothetical protein